MTQDDVFDQTGQAYLCLIHPVRQGDAYRQEVAPVLALAPSVSDDLVSAMIAGASWRERLLGLCLAMAKNPAAFVPAMLRSLRDCRGISTVPTCAALAVLARRGVLDIEDAFAGTFDRTALDGEVGWGMDEAMQVAGLHGANAPGRGPNYGQLFEDQVAVYEWLLTGQQGAAPDDDHNSPKGQSDDSGEARSR